MESETREQEDTDTKTKEHLAKIATLENFSREQLDNKMKLEKVWEKVM